MDWDRVFWWRRRHDAFADMVARNTAMDLAVDGSSRDLAKVPTFTILEVASRPLFGKAEWESSQRAMDLAFGGTVLSQAGSAIAQLVGPSAAGQVFQLVFRPELAAGLKAGELAWRSGTTIVAHGATGQIVGHGTLQAAQSASSLPMLALNLGMAAMSFQLWCIGNDLRRIEQDVREVLKRLQVASVARLFGHIDSVTYALGARDEESARRQLENLLPGLADAAEEFRLLADDHLARGSGLPGEGFFETTDHMAVRVRDWLWGYTQIADCAWKAQLALLGIRAALGERENAERLLTQVREFAVEKPREVKALVADKFCVGGNAQFPGDWSERELHFLSGAQTMPRAVTYALEQALAWEQSMSSALQVIQSPELRYTVRVEPKH